MWATWLVRDNEGLLDTNPVRDIGRSREPTGHVIYSPAEVRSLVESLDGDARIVSAIAACTGMEWSAIAAVRRRDVDIVAKTIHAHGTKNTHRDRTCSATEDWAWRIVVDHSKTLLPDALLVDAPHKDVIKAHHAARTALGLPKAGLHSHRDHYAVMLRRRGVADPIIASQLGHADTRLVQTRYGKYKPTPAEVTRAAGGIGKIDVAGARKHTRISR